MDVFRTAYGSRLVIRINPPIIGAWRIEIPLLVQITKGR